MPLNDKEKEVLTWISQGKTAWETGKILDLQPRTIEWYCLRIRQKLNAANITHAVAMMCKTGVIAQFGNMGLTAASSRFGVMMMQWADMIGPPGGNI